MLVAELFVGTNDLLVVPFARDEISDVAAGPTQVVDLAQATDRLPTLLNAIIDSRRTRIGEPPPVSEFYQELNPASRDEILTNHMRFRLKVKRNEFWFESVPAALVSKYQLPVLAEHVAEIVNRGPFRKG